MGPREDETWLKSGLLMGRYFKTFKVEPLTPLEFGSIPLAEMSAAWVWDRDEGRMRDALPAVARLVQEKAGQTRQGKAKKVDLLKDPEDRIILKGIAADWKSQVLTADSEDSFLMIKSPDCDPLILPVLKIRARISSPAPGENWMDVYWQGAGASGFSEDRKITFAWPLDGEEQTKNIPIGLILPLLLDRPISSLRLDFTSRPAKIEIKELSLDPQ